MSQEELDAIEQKRAESRITGREAFMRKLVMEGRVLILDVPEIRQMSALMGRCAGSLNQISKRVNSTGNLYQEDVADLQERYRELWGAVSTLLGKLTDL